MSNILKDKDNVINKKIIYNDYPMIRLTSINDVDENLLEDCINTIVTSNPNIIFTTIQYAKKTNTVHFYTDNAIEIKEWQKKIESSDQTALETNQDILEEIKKVLISKEKNNTCMLLEYNDNLVSLYDIGTLLRQKKNEEKKFMSNFEYQTKEKLEKAEVFSSGASSEIRKIDYLNKILTISTYKGLYSINSHFITTSLLKKDDDLEILENSDAKSIEVVRYLGTIIKDAYDELLKYEGLNTEASQCIKGINSNFYIDINKNGVTIHNLENNFSVKYNSNINNNYEYKSNSYEVIETIKACENDLFKSIYVRISDCPKWMQETLYARRKAELSEKQNKEIQPKEEQQISVPTEAKQKKLSIRSLFSFFPKTK